MNYGLTEGTRHYIQFNLTEDEGWKDLLFQNAEGQLAGLWCSRSYSTANARIEELMTECNTTRDQYRIVKRTWREEIIEHIDPDTDQSAEDDADLKDAAEADLEAQVGQVPDAGDPSFVEVVSPEAEAAKLNKE